MTGRADTAQLEVAIFAAIERAPNRERSPIVTPAIRLGNSLFSARIRKSLTSIPAIMDAPKPRAAVHVAVATYLCTLQAFRAVPFLREREGNMIPGGV